MWCYCNESDTLIGEILFLGSILNENTGICRTVARRRPFATNLSGQRMLHGWCGSTNNINVQAEGAVIVSGISEHDSQRIQVKKLDDDDKILVALCRELDVTM